MSTGLYEGVNAVVFDFDGTLADTRIDFAEMRRRTIELIHRWELWAPQFADGLYVLEMIDLAADRLNHEPESRRAFLQEAEQTLIDVEMTTVARAAPYSGVAEGLQRLCEGGLAIGIVTRNCRVCVENLLGRHPLPYEVLLTRDDVSRERLKPAPDHLLLALAALEISPAQAVMLGDHKSDIECATAAGVRGVGLLTTGTSTEEFVRLGALAVYSDMPAFVAEFCVERDL